MVLISIGIACFINTVIISKFSIFHTTIDVRFCSFPTVHKYFEFLFSVITFNLSKGVDNIFMHWQSLVFQIRIIELTPSWLLKIISPLQAIIKLEIGFECPIKNCCLMLILSNFTKLFPEKNILFFIGIYSIIFI